MSYISREQKQRHLEQQEQDAQCALVREQVIYILGTPDDLLRVQVRRLWKDNYRVNVLVGAYATAVRILDSYFVTVDDEGKIVESTPTLVNRY